MGAWHLVFAIGKSPSFGFGNLEFSDLGCGFRVWLLGNFGLSQFGNFHVALHFRVWGHGFGDSSVHNFAKCRFAVKFPDSLQTHIAAMTHREPRRERTPLLQEKPQEAVRFSRAHAFCPTIERKPSLGK